ncbi:MAG: hypothetical protein U0795_17030 [Pirellulales bacterium]
MNYGVLKKRVFQKWIMAVAMMGWLIPPSIAVSATSLESILAGARAERERIRSGLFRVVGTAQETTSWTNQTITKSLTGFGAFDVDAGLFRWDRRVDIAGGKPGAEFKCLIKPDMEFYYSENFHKAEIHLPGSGPPESNPDVGRLLDIRAFGLLFDANVESGATPDMATAALSNNPLFGKEPIIEDAGNGVARVTWTAEPVKNVTDQLEWVVDTANGYTPIRRTQTETVDGKDPLPVAMQELTWKQIDEVWVPVGYKLNSVRRVPAPNAEGVGTFARTVHWEIKWEMVNEGAISRDLFDIHKLGLPIGTVIMEAREGKPFVTERIGPKQRPPLIPGQR